MDIFSIKTLETSFEFRGVQYKLVDPPNLSYIGFLKRWREFVDARESLTTEEFMAKKYALECEQIQLYLPDMPQAVLDELGGGTFRALMDHIMVIIKTNFGATVQNIEKKN